MFYVCTVVCTCTFTNRRCIAHRLFSLSITIVFFLGGLFSDRFRRRGESSRLTREKPLISAGVAHHLLVVLLFCSLDRLAVFEARFRTIASYASQVFEMSSEKPKHACLQS